MLLAAKCLCLCLSTYCGLTRISRRTLWNLFVRFIDLREVLFPRISRILIREIRVICVQKRNSNELWSHANLANPAKCENNQFNPCNLLIICSVNVISQMKQLPCGVKTSVQSVYKILLAHRILRIHRKTHTLRLCWISSRKDAKERKGKMKD